MHYIFSTYLYTTSSSHFFDITPCKSSTSRVSSQEPLGGTGELSIMLRSAAKAVSKAMVGTCRPCPNGTPRKTWRPDEALVSYPVERPEGCLTCIRDDTTSPARMHLHFNFLSTPIVASSFLFCYRQKRRHNDAARQSDRDSGGGNTYRNGHQYQRPDAQ